MTELEEVVAVCDECGEKLYEYDWIWSLSGWYYCEDCAERLFRRKGTRCD